MDAGEYTTDRFTGEIDRTVVESYVTGSSDTYILSENSDFKGEIPQLRCRVEHELKDGTLDIMDSAVNTLVVGARGTVINSEGMKARLNITDTPYSPGICAPESDVPAQHSNVRNRPEQTHGGSVVFNSVVGSSGTNISMDGAVVRMKRRKKKGERPPPKAGEINFTNSAAINMVAYSHDTDVNMKNVDINIE